MQQMRRRTDIAGRAGSQHWKPEKKRKTIAHHLYEVLRDFDQSAVKSIYSEAFYTPKMGQAIMNRLLKAAGHKIIRAEE